MQKVVGVTFNKKGRVYNFNANNFDLNIGDSVIVETEKGLQYGVVVKFISPKDVDKKMDYKKVVSTLKSLTDELDNIFRNNERGED